MQSFFLNKHDLTSGSVILGCTRTFFCSLMFISRFLALLDSSLTGAYSITQSLLEVIRLSASAYGRLAMHSQTLGPQQGKGSARNIYSSHLTNQIGLKQEQTISQHPHSWRSWRGQSVMRLAFGILKTMSASICGPASTKTLPLLRLQCLTMCMILMSQNCTSRCCGRLWMNQCLIISGYCSNNQNNHNLHTLMSLKFNTVSSARLAACHSPTSHACKFIPHLPRWYCASWVPGWFGSTCCEQPCCQCR